MRLLTLLCLTLIAGCHPWFKVGLPDRESADPQLISPDGQRYRAGTPSWVPLIDQCMSEGGSRNDCIAGLPPEELAALEAWERSHGRRELLNHDRLPGPSE